MRSTSPSKQVALSGSARRANSRTRARLSAADNANTQVRSVGGRGSKRMLAVRIRITSYNVCYTKLLRFTTLQPRTQDAVEQSIGETLDALENARNLTPGTLV